MRLGSGVRGVVFLAASVGFACRAAPPEAAAPDRSASAVDAPATERAERELVDVFVGGADGYPAYRIPALLATRRGTLLAFAEGRATLDDHARNDLVLKRSFDGGRTWGELIAVAEAGANALNNPCAVELPDTGRVLLVFQRYPAAHGEYGVEPGFDGERVCRTLLAHSDDDGATWSTPREITRDVKRGAPVTSIASGPGVGLVKRRAPHAGRVVVPFNQGPANQWKVYAAFSDDQGATWRMGAVAPESAEPGVANEVQMAELADGSLVLDARSFSGARCRKLARSVDGGATWSALVDEPELVDPSCMAALLAFELDGELLLLHSGPESATKRELGTLRASRDGGSTWPLTLPIHPAGFAYSALAPLDATHVGCLFERDGYAALAFTRISLEPLRR
ncbi:MAG: glycoside hydrolase [Planctomycetes bacterium]|nr:glycoside hydrolase [Planctomycetota bacterium]